MTILRPRNVVVALVLLGLLGAGLWAFQPWRLFTSTTVREALPQVSAPSEPAAATASAPVTTASASASAFASTSASTANGPVNLASGTFLTHEHATTGRATVIRLADGNRVLRLEGLDTSDGPDLHVWLSDQPVRPGRDGWTVFDDGAYLDLGPLKGNKGDQNYPVPADADLAKLTSVSVWCARFKVSFGAAALSVTS